MTAILGLCSRIFTMVYFLVLLSKSVYLTCVHSTNVIMKNHSYYEIPVLLWNCSFNTEFQCYSSAFLSKPDNWSFSDRFLLKF